MARHRFFFAACWFVLGTLCGAGVYQLSSALAQTVLDEEDELTAELRDEMYADLAQDVAHLESEGALLKRVVKLVSPTVVHIEAEKEDPKARGTARSRTVQEAGSGVIYRATDGRDFVLTNRHVIRDARRDHITINLSDGRQLHPDNYWVDEGTDIAVMAVSAQGLIAARLGDSDNVEIGDFVLAVGSPFGLSRSVTYGIISAKGRRDLELGDDAVRYQDFLQTDAAINPGNSGGPLLSLRGEVIGINTAIATASGGNEGIGFSIPINMVMVIANQLIERGTVARAYLGVNLDQRFTSAMAVAAGLNRLQGARVTGITPDSPAEDAGLQVGDVILTYDGHRIEDDGHLVNLVSLTPVDKEVALLVLRDRERITIQVKVGDRSRFESKS
jgi:serine protease Do